MAKFRKKPVVIDAVLWDGRMTTVEPLLAGSTTLLLTVARVLRARISTADEWGGDDIAALDEALAPWSAEPGEPSNEKGEQS